ncbi:YqaJ viral recombinase family protein [Stenotrophomonas sp. C2852]|nr:YqaJ viral recombinase family protein [Stenotrophomonas sp. C2852]MDV3437319.1 YqaJ viral recombinase family protein [Stenotrophomonas sp. C2852]
MRTVNLIQGSPEWHAHRAQHLNASDAPAMLGASTNHSRTDLIRELAAGVPREFSDFVQERVIDPGHEFEAQARAIAEQLVGEDLYPVTGVAGKYSASFDGLTLLEDIAWEHKRLNQTLRDAMFDGCTGTDLPLMYQIQMEHQAMVSQCERVFFMASEWRQTSGGWELVEERHCWYMPNPELRARIVAGWAQLEADVAAFEPGPASEPAPVGRAPETLPALSIRVTGMVTASNLAEFKENALAVLGSINRELQSDAAPASRPVLAGHHQTPRPAAPGQRQHRQPDQRRAGCPVRDRAPLGLRRSSSMTSIHVKPAFSGATDREKDQARQKLASDMARFAAAGGKVQVLGTTGIDKSTISRRQVVEGGHGRRAGKKAG